MPSSLHISNCKQTTKPNSLSVFAQQRRGSIENIASVKERIENYMSATTAVAADGETSMQPPPIKELLKSPLSPPHQTRPKSILVSPG